MAVVKRFQILKLSVLVVSAKTADPKTFNGSPHVIKEAEKKCSVTI